MSCAGVTTTISMLPTFSRSRIMTSRLEQGSWRERCKRGRMKRSRAATGNIRVCAGPLCTDRNPQPDTLGAGTWVPLRDGRLLAERNNVLDKLRPIFDYVPGDVSPPQAPKHTTNSNKPRVPKVPNVRKTTSERCLPLSAYSLTDGQNPK